MKAEDKSMPESTNCFGTRDNSAQGSHVKAEAKFAVAAFNSRVSDLKAKIAYHEDKLAGAGHL